MRTIHENPVSRSQTLLLTLVFASAWTACSASGGGSGSGGSSASGGERATGGASSGGTTGTVSGVGGSSPVGSGGKVGTGGDVGVATGGSAATGGKIGSGGSASGGVTSTGGLTGSGGDVPGGSGGRVMPPDAGQAGGSVARPDAGLGTGGTAGSTGSTEVPKGNAPVPSPGCGKTPTLKSSTQTITSAGQSRQFIIDIPTDYDNSKPYKLIFGFHWMGGTMTDVATGQTVTKNVWAYYGLKQLDTPRSAIFVAGQGIGNAWPNTNGQDVTFVDDMIKLIENDLCIDTSRIFSVGFSYGGMMGNTLACERPDVFRAISSHSGAGSCSKTQKPVPFFGAGGTESRDGVKTTARRIAKANGCTDQDPPYPAAGSLSHTCTSFQGCRDGYPVRFCPFDQEHKAAPYDGGCAGCDDGNKTWLPKEDWTFFTQF
jgi:poly(3-hydroxybutyrate) depolymerase